MPEETETEQQAVTESGESTEVEEQDAGAETESTETAEDALEADRPKPKEPFDQKRAEAAIRKKNSEAENLRKRLKELEPLAAELQRIKDAEKSDTERLTDQLAAANERITKTRERLVRTQVQALAATSFADADDPLGELDLNSYIDSDGDIDEAAIKTDLAALLERKPHWAKAAPPPEGSRRPAPDRTQASGANKQRSSDPADVLAGFITSRLKSSR